MPSSLQGKQSNNEACLPDINGATEPPQRHLRNNGIQAAVRSYRTLQQEFSLLQTNVAYMIPFMVIPHEA